MWHLYQTKRSKKYAKRTGESDEAKQEECREKILAASGFLLDLVNNVLDMNKLESGEIQLEHTSFDLESLLQETTSVIEVQAAEHLSLIHI